MSLLNKGCCGVPLPCPYPNPVTPAGHPNYRRGALVGAAVVACFAGVDLFAAGAAFFVKSVVFFAAAAPFLGAAPFTATCCLNVAPALNPTLRPI